MNCDHWHKPSAVAQILTENHYLGPIRQGVAWWDEYGVIVVKRPSSRHIPRQWLELARWCITSDTPNAGSRQWAAFVRAARKAFPDVTTIVSYSDPAQGHTGALYRACNWWWAPTWHRLRKPPTGNGAWRADSPQGVKDRWVFPLQPDGERESRLIANDKSVLKRYPFARYQEPGGADYKRFMEQ